MAFTRSISRLALALSFSPLCLAQSTTLDDSDPSITYTGTWQHDNVGADYLYSGSQSWTNDPRATLSFAFTGTGFDYCAGLKADRGSFAWSVDDGIQSGTGTQLGPSMTESTCSNVASVRDLDVGEHTVVISNSGRQYLAADSFTLYTDGPVSATLAASTSIATRTRASTIASMSMLPSSTSSSIGKATISAANRTVTSKEDENAAKGKKAAVIGGSIAGVLGAAIMLGVGFWLFRRRTAQRDSMLYPDLTSARDLDEKMFEYNEKRPLSTAAGPAGGIPRSHGMGNLHKRNISKGDSLESRSSFQPETLRNAPVIQPYHPQQFTPSHSVSNSLVSFQTELTKPAPVFNSPPREKMNVANPFDVTPLRTKSSYENRLEAASASLPDWQYSQPIPRSNFLQPTALPTPRVVSDASSAYPATEGRRSQVRNSAYSGMEDDDEDPGELYEDYTNERA